MVDGILQGLSWLGLEWDEGPYFQSQRLKQYRSAAQTLLKKGSAYHCFCSMESLTARREAATRAKQAWKYEGTCRGLSDREIQTKMDAGIPAVIRFKVPQEGKIGFLDQVFGRIEHPIESVEDFVLLRSDGMPTYHLSVVVDDIDLRISHIIRGADHISNTPKQVLLYRALDSPFPLFAHVPLILGPDKSRLSKRHGATSVTAYREQGYLPEAFRNFLALLGWSPGTEQEQMSTAELIERFSLGGINKSNAVFNLEKLAWLNGEYIRASSAETLYPFVKTELERSDLWDSEFETVQKAWFLSLVDLLKSRVRLLTDFVHNGRPFLSDDFEIEASAKEKFLKDPALVHLMPKLASQLGELTPFELPGLEDCLRGFANHQHVKAGLLINAARVLLTGKAVAPGIFEVMTTLGRERTVTRLQKSIL
jgi:glutamyl-tRNA synthetase